MGIRPDMGAQMNDTMPIHPTMRHPLTGEPLRAVWVRPDGRAMWPVMGAAPDDPAGGGDGDPGGGGGAEDGKTDPPTRGPGADGTKPISEMTDAEKADYFSKKSDRLGGVLKSFGGITPEQFAELKAKAERADALDYELSSDKDKAVADATKKAVEDAAALYRPQLAETAFRVAIGDQKTAEEVDDFVADLNLERFLDDKGGVDVAKVLARVQQFTGAQQQRRGPSGTGLGGHSPVTPQLGAQAAAQAAKRGWGAQQTS